MTETHTHWEIFILGGVLMMTLGLFWLHVNDIFQARQHIPVGYSLQETCTEYTDTPIVQEYTAKEEAQCASDALNDIITEQCITYYIRRCDWVFDEIDYTEPKLQCDINLSGETITRTDRRCRSYEARFTKEATT